MTDIFKFKRGDLVTKNNETYVVAERCAVPAKNGAARYVVQPHPRRRRDRSVVMTETGMERAPAPTPLGQ